MKPLVILILEALKGCSEKFVNQVLYLATFLSHNNSISTVAIIAENSVHFVILYLACIIAKKRILLIDINRHPTEIAKFIDTCNCDTVFYSKNANFYKDMEFYKNVRHIARIESIGVISNAPLELLMDDIKSFEDKVYNNDDVIIYQVTNSTDTIIGNITEMTGENLYYGVKSLLPALRLNEPILINQNVPLSRYSALGILLPLLSGKALRLEASLPTSHVILFKADHMSCYISNMLVEKYTFMNMYKKLYEKHKYIFDNVDILTAIPIVRWFVKRKIKKSFHKLLRDNGCDSITIINGLKDLVILNQIRLLDLPISEFYTHSNVCGAIGYISQHLYSLPELGYIRSVSILPVERNVCNTLHNFKSQIQLNDYFVDVCIKNEVFSYPIAKHNINNLSNDLHLAKQVFSQLLFIKHSTIVNYQGENILVVELNMSYVINTRLSVENIKKICADLIKKLNNNLCGDDKIKSFIIRELLKDDEQEIKEYFHTAVNNKV